MSLIGSLNEVKIADVLRLFSAGKKSGLLTVAAGGHAATLRFYRGAVVHAAAGRYYGEEAVMDLFGWKEGQLTFVPDDKTVTPNVKKSVDVLILEGVKLGDSVHRMHELIPSDRVVFQMATGPSDPAARYTVGPPEWQILRILDGVREVREVAEASKVPRAEVMRILFEMTEAGFLERIEVQKALRVQSQGLFGKDSATVDERLEDDWRRIHRFAGGVQKIEVRSTSGKSLSLPVGFRPGLFRDVHLPRTALADLAVREGEDVNVRPIG